MLSRPPPPSHTYTLKLKYKQKKWAKPWGNNPNKWWLILPCHPTPSCAFLMYFQVCQVLSLVLYTYIYILQVYIHKKLREKGKKKHKFSHLSLSKLKTGMCVCVFFNLSHFPSIFLFRGLPPTIKSSVW